MPGSPVECDIWQTAIPMRGFEHAAASRDLAEAVVVRVRLDDGREGWGETLPRPYVTGETLDSVVADLRRLLWPALVSAWRKGMSVGDASAAVPASDGGRCLNAAACGLELALVGALGVPGPWRCGNARPAARASGVLGSSDSLRTARRLRLMRWYGLRDFKLKLGLGEEADAANLRVVEKQIGRAVARGRMTLRVDANAGWPAPETPERVAALKRLGVCVVEQPARCSAGELAELARRCELPLMADESLVTEADASELLAGGLGIWWNIRLSKNGGLGRARQIAQLAARHGVPFTIGCMVGESGILSAWQRHLLATAPPPRFVEGSYGRFLLADDLTRPSPRIGYGGRLKPLRGARLGVAVRPDKLAAYGARVATLTA